MICYSHNGLEYHGLDVEERLEGIRALDSAHFAETEVLYQRTPIEMDYPSLIAHQHAGRLFGCGVTKQESGQLVGQLFYYVSKSLHCRALNAVDDRVYVIPEYRGAGIAKRLLKYGEERLKELGVTDIYHSSKGPAGGPNLDRFFGSQGYTPIATVFHKGL